MREKVTSPNEGEGGRTAARRFDAAQADFAKTGKAAAAGKAAKKALEGPYKRELRKAESAAKSRAKH